MVATTEGPGQVAAGAAGRREAIGSAPAAQRELSPLGSRGPVLKARLAAAPRSAGVYLFRGFGGEVIYVGKSGRLRDRLRSYFVNPQSHPARIRRLVESVFDFEVIAAGSEQEALILENTLIKRYHPRFNVRLRDDKNYLYFEIPQPRGTATTEVPEEISARLAAYPKPGFGRRIGSGGGRFFGPFTDAKAIRGSVRELRTVFPFRGCPDPVFRRGKVCLDYHLGICAGPCEGLISPADYRLLLDDAATFMAGHTQVVSDRLTAVMARASEAMDFERAASLRDRLQTIHRLTKDQAASPRTTGDSDVIGLASDGAHGMVAVLTVREGRLQGMERHALEGVGEVGSEEILDSFLAQYYTNAASVPALVVVPVTPPSRPLLIEALGAKRGSRVEIKVAQRGSLRILQERATSTAAAALKQASVARDFDRDRYQAILADLQQRLGLAEPPHRIECYDISNTMGQQSVGSMVVFEDARPKPSDYRIFGIKSVEGPNDFASMEEVLGRRFTHLANPPDEMETSFGVRPDLVIVDGGPGQLAAAHRALTRLGFGELPLFGLAKRFEELFRVGFKDPIHLPEASPSLFLVQRVRDEAHRFAITGHRARRQKAGLKSRLDEITGIGPRRKRALLRQFGSLEAMRAASVEELIAVPGVTRPVAVAIKELL